ncbi:hypothetical protein KIN20_030841 [Parelaphostrongylus tenuis]|uniref:Uncharacterized protein n=1 Tax=Parelaphostrongylus tenuis TaxID=148309 RepID=A0AAD5R4L3_PARTN|nr:hypothetical protein KIN20_030841 [Parelaphostrongylus tenuis]
MLSWCNFVISSVTLLTDDQLQIAESESLKVAKDYQNCTPKVSVNDRKSREALRRRKVFYVRHYISALRPIFRNQFRNYVCV